MTTRRITISTGLIAEAMAKAVAACAAQGIDISVEDQQAALKAAREDAPVRFGRKPPNNAARTREERWRERNRRRNAQ